MVDMTVAEGIIMSDTVNKYDIKMEYRKKLNDVFKLKTMWAALSTSDTINNLHIGTNNFPKATFWISLTI